VYTKGPQNQKLKNRENPPKTPANEKPHRLLHHPKHPNKKPTKQKGTHKKPPKQTSHDHLPLKTQRFSLQQETSPQNPSSHLKHRQKEILSKVLVNELRPRPSAKNHPFHTQSEPDLITNATRLHTPPLVKRKARPKEWREENL
jgi:hypothetical protein